MPASMGAGLLPRQTARAELEEKGLCRVSFFVAFSHCSWDKTKKSVCFLFHGQHAAILVLFGNHGKSDFPPSSEASDRKVRVKNLWEEFFSDPSKWWDKRSSKTSTQHPDFKHKVTFEVLWIDSWLNPPWVKEKLARMAFDMIQSGGETQPRDPSFSCNYDKVRQLANEGRLKEALHLLELMAREASEAPQGAVVCLLTACTRRKALAEGKQLHALIDKTKYYRSIFLLNLLIGMYSACGDVADAHKVFTAIRQQNVFSWTALILAYANNRQYEEAITLFQKMHRAGIEPDEVACVIALKAYANIADLEQGRNLHSLILKKGFGSNITVQNALVNMYAKCGCLKDARRLFDNMNERNVVSWNAMLAGYTQVGLGKEALDLYERMNPEGTQPNDVTLVLLLKACGSISAMQQGKQLHSLILKNGLESQLIVQNTLVDMYSKCGHLKYARELFANMNQRNVVSWNAMIAGYAREGLGKEALDLYEQMKSEGMEPNDVTLVLLLKSCASISALQQGKQFHSLIIEKGLESQLTIQNTLVDMYAKCQCLNEAREIFDSMVERDVVSWTAMIAGYSQEGLGKEALDLYEQMKHDDMEPNTVTFVLLLKACASISALEQGKQLHSLISQKGLDSQLIVQTALLDMYSKCGSLKDARELFDNMTERDVVSWSAMIAGYVQEGLGKEALDLYEQMKHEGLEPNDITLVLLLKACASLLALQQGKQLHSFILEQGLESQLVIQNTLLDMYSKCGCLKAARKLFDNMAKADVVSWNAMIAGYTQEGLGWEALDLYEQMKSEGMEPDTITLVLLLKACGGISALQQGKQFHSVILEKGLESQLIVQNILVDMYSKCGRLSNARELFDNMAERDVVSWTTMIAGYTKAGIGKEALDLYEQMKSENVEPNDTTLVLLVKACASISALQQGKQLHSVILQHGLESQLIVQTALIDMYSKCGRLKDAREIFDNMAERDLVSWTAMIAGYGQDGLGKEVLDLFQQMKDEGLQATDVTYTCVLSACSHSGLVNKGRSVFENMSKVDGVTPTLSHYACMVDLLGRAGCLYDAEDLIVKMPIPPDNIVWLSLLGAARKYANVEIGLRAFERCVELEPENAAPYLLLMDIYLAAGRIDEVARLRKEMNGKGLEKGFGCVSIEVNKEGLVGA